MRLSAIIVKPFLSAALLFIAAFLFTPAAYAQKTHTFELEGDTTQQCLYNGLKVIDLRADKTDLGYVRTTALEIKTTLVTRKPLDVHLQEYYSKILTSTSQQEMVMVIHGISIEDGIHSQPIGTVHFDFDLFTGSNDKYVFIGSLDTLFEVSGKWDVTRKLLQLIQQKLTESIVYFANIKADGPATYTHEQMLGRRKAIKLPYAIYNTESFKEGIYLTKADFVAHMPQDTGIMHSLVAMGNTTAHNFYYRNQRGKKGDRINAKDYFAIYTDGVWYAGRGDHPSKMEFRDGDFYTSRFFWGIVKPNEARVAPMLGGPLADIVIICLTGEHPPQGIVRYESRFHPEQQRWKPHRRLE